MHIFPSAESTKLDP